MRAHTITTKARARGRGRRKRTVVPRGILALSLAVVLFAATASTAGAGRGLDQSEGGPSVTSGAEAAKFKGSTDQGLDVTVRVSDDGLVNRVNIEDRVRCQPQDHFKGHSTYKAPLDESTPTSFADKKRNTTHPGAARVRVKHEITGEKISDTECGPGPRSARSARTVTNPSAARRARSNGRRRSSPKNGASEQGRKPEGGRRVSAPASVGALLVGGERARSGLFG
jgi:hypothetical protein